jgi:hypothetical protein
MLRLCKGQRVLDVGGREEDEINSKRRVPPGNAGVSPPAKMKRAMDLSTAILTQVKRPSGEKQASGLYNTLLGVKAWNRPTTLEQDSVAASRGRGRR